MATKNFEYQDQLEYIYRESHYGSGGAMRRIRHHLRKLKVYIIILIVSAVGGAGAVWLPDILNPPQSAEGGDLMQMLKDRAQQDPKLLEQYKDQLKGMR